jgi:hypothetical protein
MRLGLIAAAAVLSSNLGAALADEAPTAPAATPLQPVLQPLAYLIGKRSCAGTFLKSGKAITSSETISPELSGHWLVLRHEDTPPFRFDAVEMWGYDPQKQRFVAYMYDSSGGVRQYDSPGWNGDSFTWTDINTSAGKRDRFVFEKHPDSAYQFTYETSADGVTWTAGDSLLCKPAT